MFIEDLNNQFFLSLFVFYIYLYSAFFTKNFIIEIFYFFFALTSDFFGVKFKLITFYFGDNEAFAPNQLYSTALCCKVLGLT